MDGEALRSPKLSAPRISVLGGAVDVVTPREVLDFVDSNARPGRRALIANHNLHSLYLYRRSADMRGFYARADLIEADSTPMILWARLLGLPISRAHRCTYLDWREDFWRRAGERRWRVFYLGGAPGVAQRGAEAVDARWPGQSIAVRDGFFDMGGPQNAEIVAAINAFKPHVLLVGMGMPRQEAWLAANLDALTCGVAMPVGAAFDYEAGAIPTPPRWTGRVGLEWLFRLAAEPRRLMFRYLVEPWALIGPALGDLAAGMRRALSAAR